MSSDSASRMPHKHANGFMTVLALGVLGLSLLVCLYVLVGFSAEAQVKVNGSTIESTASVNQPSAFTAQAASPETQVPSTDTQAPATAPQPAYGQAGQAPSTATPAPRQPYSFQPSVPAPAPPPVRRRAVPVYLMPMPASAFEQQAAQAQAAAAAQSQAASAELRGQLGVVKDQLTQSEQLLKQAQESQHSTRSASAIFLGIFALIASLIVVQVYFQARGWDRETKRSGDKLEALEKQIEDVRDSGGEYRNALPALLQEIGEQPLSYQEEGAAFAPRATALMEEIDHLAYVGQGRLAFRDLPSRSEATVYMNGLLLSAVSRLSHADPWTAYGRLDQFFSLLTQFPDAVERLRIAQGYSYRALAAYQVLANQNKEPSWLRKSERSHLEDLSKQAFEDVAQASAVDPEWKHAIYVEAMLCSRFYFADESTEGNGRNELQVRGLRRAVSLYKSLIDERAYRGPSRRNLVRALKQIAEKTGEKSDFSDFGYALNAFPSDEELADEALAARHPDSQDRFLWQWLMGDEELFANVQRLNLAEYRAFWIRMLDNKVHLRNWRSDLVELQQSNPAMKDWNIQLVQVDPPISLASAISRRLERYDSSASGA